MSIGVAGLAPETTDILVFLSEVDTALFRTKRDGATGLS